MRWALSNRLFFTAIFLSGGSALIYQLIWVRLLGLVFGVSSFAVATVVAVFLLGLGLGSYFFGRWSEHAKDPLRIYVYVELGIAALSMVSYVIIDALPVYRHVYEYAYNNLGLYGLSLVRLVLSIVVLLPPVFLIGGTMPLIAKYFITAPQQLGSNFSKLYYFNTLGASAGVLLTGFVFVQYFGVFATLMIAVAGNLAVALIIGGARTATKPVRASAAEKAPYSYMLVVLFVTGFVSLSYEMLWVRILSTYSLSTSQAFALIVAGFLLGFSVGSFLVSRKVDRRARLEAWFGRVCIATAFSGAVVLLMFRRFEQITVFLAESTTADYFTLSLAMAFVVSFIPAVFMGILFPLGLRIYARDVHRIGVKAGKIFLANTTGCVLGTLLTGFVLIPFVGMWNTTLILVNLSLLIAAYMVLRETRFPRAQGASLLAVALLANLLVFSDSKTFHAELKGPDYHTAATGFEVIYYAEGLSGTVTAIEGRNYRGLFVDGQNVSGTDPVLLADSRMLAHIPLLLVDDPRAALTVGYGTGTISGSMLLHDVEVHAVDIEEKIIEAAPLFESVNYGSHLDPKLRIVLDDARNYIDVVDEKFDVIVTDVTNLKYKRNPYLYTREYFQIMQDALSEEGVAAAWLPLGGLSFDDLKTLIATFDDVYPHTTVWYFTPYPTHFIILVGSKAPLAIDIATLSAKMDKVREDLLTVRVENVYQLGSMLLLGEQDVDDLVAGQALHTDNHPILEFSDMRLYMATDVAPNLKRLLNYQQERLDRYFAGSDAELTRLKDHFRQYTRHYRAYIRQYEREMARRDR